MCPKVFKEHKVTCHPVLLSSWCHPAVILLTSCPNTIYLVADLSQSANCHTLTDMCNSTYAIASKKDAVFTTSKRVNSTCRSRPESLRHGGGGGARSGRGLGGGGDVRPGHVQPPRRPDVRQLHNVRQYNVQGHCVSLCVIVCHCVSLCVIVCHCVIMCHCKSLCVIACNCVSLCLIVCHCVSLSLCVFVFLCVSLCVIVGHCVIVSLSFIVSLYTV